MPAYVISDVDVLDPLLVGQYRDLAQVTIARYGGRYIVRGGAIDRGQGEWSPRVPGLAKAHGWYRSQEYAEALKVHRQALDRWLIFVEGVPPAYDDEGTLAVQGIS